MNKKILKKLISISFTNGNINRDSVIQIANYLKRKELKVYIKELKRHINKTTVLIEIPKKTGEKYIEQLRQEFASKKVIVKRNPSLIVGIKIREDDNIYEVSLQDKLRSIGSYLDKMYD